MKKIVILGAGTGGTMSAHHLRRRLSNKEWDITVIDKSETHYYQPGFLFIPYRFYGYNDLSAVTKPTRGLLPHHVNYVNAGITLIDTTNNTIRTTAGDFSYDWLISSLGSHISVDAVEGMRDGYGKNIFTFYDPDGAIEFQKGLERFKGGRFVLNIAEMPIKCPVGPIEFIFLADYYFYKKGIRSKVEIEFVTPLDGAFTKPIASDVFGRIARQKNIKITPSFNISGVDHERRKITSYDGKEVDYDFLVAVPPFEGSSVVEESGLGNGAGYIHTDKQTLKALGHDNIYSIGDGTDLPTSKAGSVAHFESEIITENLLSEIKGGSPVAKFDGHSNCFIESGFDKALIIDFNYKVEPLPGKYPFPIIGPFSLLKETKINHLGKLGFRWAYWNQLLPGSRVLSDPIITVKCSPRGKNVDMLKGGIDLFDV